jgi:CxxC-x17-CxxC domain-containing protein
MQHIGDTYRIPDVLSEKGVRVLGYRERRSYDRGPREMHKIICSECGKEDEVPFKPTEGRPVYCRECYQKHRPQRRY